MKCGRAVFISILLLSFTLFVSAQTNMGRLADELNEVSGITLTDNKIIFAWVHNDSGDSSRIFGISSNGKILSTLYFKGLEPGGSVRDCEDIASGKGEKGHKNFIYLADIGDNGAHRPYITLYRIREPRHVKPLEVVETDPVILRYPDGPRDAETLMIDNVERLAYIISKREDTVAVYSTPLRWKKGDTIMLHKRTTLFLPGLRPQKWVVSGDISRDGSKILLKTLHHVYYWERKKGEAVWQTLQRPYQQLPYQPEPQGEAIGFNVQATGYYTVSEGNNPPIYFYQLPLLPK